MRFGRCAGLSPARSPLVLAVKLQLAGGRHDSTGQSNGFSCFCRLRPLRPDGALRQGREPGCRRHHRVCGGAVAAAKPTLLLTSRRRASAVVRLAGVAPVDPGVSSKIE